MAKITGTGSDDTLTGGLGSDVIEGLGGKGCNDLIGTQKKRVQRAR